MKKVIISVLLLACMTCVFAKSHLNFTAPCKISILHNDETYNSVQGSEICQKSRGNSELQATTGLTAEYLYTFGERAFGIGAKIGCDAGNVGMTVDISETSFSTRGSTAGWNIAPALGFILGDSTKKQITLYPIGYEFYSLTKLKDEDNYKFKDSTIETLTSGAAFSWQWGSKVYNGFEIGFNILLNPVLKVDGKNYFNTEGMGIDFHAAYKLTLDL